MLLSCNPRGRDCGAQILFQSMFGPFGTSSVEVSALGKRGRRGVCRVMHKGRVVGRSSTFENLTKRKQAGLKVGSGGWAIRGVVLRCKGYMGIKLRNQVVQIAMWFDCRWIGQPVERCSNNHQAQQTRRDLGSHSLVALCTYPSGKSVAYSHWPRQQRHPLFLRCKKLYGR